MMTSVKQRDIAIITNSDLMTYGLKTLLDHEYYNLHFFDTVNVFLTSHFSATVLFLYDASENEINLSQNISTLIQQKPNLKIIVLSACSNSKFVIQILNSGASGFLCLHDNVCQRILLILQENQTDRLWLSPTSQSALAEMQHFQSIKLTLYQRQVLQHMLQLKTASQIAIELNRSQDAIYQIQRYLRELYAVTTNTALIQKLQSNKLFVLD